MAIQIFHNGTTSVGLAEWRRKQGLTQLALAARLDTSLSSVCRYENGTRIPEPDMMTLIWVETDGQVDPNSFHRLPALTPMKVAA